MDDPLGFAPNDHDVRVENLLFLSGGSVGPGELSMAPVWSE